MALRFIKTHPCSTKRIPGILSGILFLFSPLLLKASDSSLSEELFCEGNYPACARESLRVLSQSPTNETAVLLHTCAVLRTGSADINTGLSTLLQLARQARETEIRAQAANEAAWLLFSRGNISNAWKLAEQAFLTSTNSSISLSSGALLTRMTIHHPKQAAPSLSLALQMATCAPVLAGIPPPPFLPCASKDHGSLLSRPGQWIVAFYRFAIRPAIGSRCSLSPSCSEYFLQASRKHKLLAFPMIADRLVREPSVVNAAQHTSQVNGKTLVLDPLDNHDFWMTSHP